METTIKKVKVCNLKSNKTGRAVPKQFEIQTEDGIYFQSYNTVIAAKIKGKIYLHNGEGSDNWAWDCSKTTGKYRNQFLGKTLAETRAKIKSGEYILTDLN
jgi:hypothetical protein